MAQTYVNLIKNSPFQGYKVSDLRKLARESRVKYYYKLTKLDLVIALTNKALVNNTNIKKIEKILTRKL